jgi:hypothetical protein
MSDNTTTDFDDYLDKRIKALNTEYHNRKKDEAFLRFIREMREWCCGRCKGERRYNGTDNDRLCTCKTDCVKQQPEVKP